ncbi:MAG: hypothetical protein ACOYXW_15975 [Actinomycetota bacterium]
MSWPDDGIALWAELERHPGRLAVVVRDREPAMSLAGLLGVEPCKVGQRLTDLPSPPDPSAASVLLSGERVLVDLDVLFDPAMFLDPIRFLRDHSRYASGLVAVWPGDVVGDRATYSVEGRFDRYVSDLTDTLVLRARRVDFPDETPFTTERIP